MNFINITNKRSVDGKEYLYYYEIKMNNVIIGFSNVIKGDIEEDGDLLSIDITSINDKIYYKNIVMQSILKYVNLIGENVKKELYIILPNNAYYEIFIVMSEKFKYISNIDSRRVYKLSVNENFIESLKNVSSRRSYDRYKTTKLKGYDKTYIISAAKINGLIYTTLQNYLNRNDLNEVSSNTSRPFLLWIEMMENMKFDSTYFLTNCYLMNILNDNKIIITNKANLYFNFNRYYPEQCEKYMARSWYINDFITNNKLMDGLRANKNRDENKKVVYIVRPAGTGAFSGKDIYVIDDIKSLINSRDNTRKYEKVIVSEYITNPLLLEGKKMHLRVYFLVALIDGYIATNIFDFYEVFTAVKPYKNGDYQNADIHDTHARGNNKEMIYPFDIIDSVLYNDYLNIYIPKIKDCLHYVSRFIKGKIGIYPQSKNAFEVFGCDFLITTDNNIILMEINDKVGYKCQSMDTTFKLSKLYFDTLIKNIFKPILNNKLITDEEWIYTAKLV